MVIQELNIRSFGTLRDRTVSFSRGLNIVEGKNESGKSTLAMFIKFMLYGLSGRASGGALTERRRYVNWDSGQASGSMTVADGDRQWRVERTLTLSAREGQRETSHETVRLIDARTNAPLPIDGSPGETLFGVPEAIFLNTVFVRQIDGARPSGDTLLSSIENLLFTADENLTTEKAIERLDAARRQILYKNGAGGSLTARRAARSEASAALLAAQRQGSALDAAEDELRAAEAACAEVQEKIGRQAALCACGETNLLRRRFDALGAMERKLEAMDRTLGERTARGVDREYLGALGECDKRLAEETAVLGRLEAAMAAAEEKTAAADQTAGEISRETKEAQREANRLGDRRRSLSAAAGTLLFFAVLVAVGAWAVHAFHIMPYPILLAAAGVLFVLAILCLILRGRASSALGDLLREWGALDAEGLPAAVAESRGGAPDTETMHDELHTLHAAHAEAIAKRKADAAHAAELAGRILPDAALTEDAADARATLAEARAQGEAFCRETETLREETDTLRGRLSILREQLSVHDENEVRRAFTENMKTAEGRIASGMDAARLDAAKKELGALKEERRAAEARRHELETRLAAQRAVSEPPAVLAARISALDAEIDELSLRHEAYCLAIDTLRGAAQSVREQVLPDVVADACAAANRISDGAFEAIGVDRGLSMCFTRDGQTHDVEYLSEGTKDIAYISLRRALSRALFGGRQPPLIYDESFSRVDEERLTRILEMLAVPPEGDAQSILLTCRTLEATLAADAGDVRIITL